MRRVIGFAKANAVIVVIGATGLIAWAVFFQYAVGLNASIAAVLYLLGVGATLAVYRLSKRGPVTWDERLSWPRLIVSAVVGFLVMGLAIQAVPLGRAYSNPPITGEPAWDSPRTRELTVRACFDCHSNEVEYPWYSKVAPVSWAVERHVSAGREKVNYSEWDKPQRDAEESTETVREGSMPPLYFTLLAHSEARLTEAEKQELIAGLVATFGDD